VPEPSAPSSPALWTEPAPGGGAHQLRYSSAGRWRRRSHHPHPHETRFPGHHRPLPRRHRRPV